MSQEPIRTLDPESGDIVESYRVPIGEGVVLRPAGPNSPIPYDPLAIINRAVANNADVATLEKLMALYERWQANQARQAFDEAIAAAKARITPIAKNRTVAFESNKPGAKDTSYRHEDLAAIAAAIDPILGEFGLSYRFRTVSGPNEPVTVTCIISHRAGHSEENTLKGPPDNTGNKNSLQAVGSTVTYLQRYTLKAALGLAVAADDDGTAGAGPEKINHEQYVRLTGLMTEVDADETAFMKFFKITMVADLPAKRFDEAMTLLGKKKRAAKS